jgi:hypothetical protein
MSFVTLPLAIAGLVGMVIPIIIHLLARQRRKPIAWAAMRFLIEAYQRQRRRLQLEQLLLLALRCLIVGVLGASLARPVLRAAGVLDLGGARAVYLVIDNGLTSSLRREDGTTALAAHLEQARTIIGKLDAADAVGLITAGGPARPLVVPPSTDHAGALEALDAIAATESPADVRGALAILGAALEERDDEDRTTLAYLISEFRAGSAALEDPLPRTLVRLPERARLLATVPSVEPVGNTQVVAIEPVRSMMLPGAMDGSGQVTVRLRRSGGDLGAEVSRVRLEGKDLVHLEPRQVEWKPGQTESDVEFRVAFATQGERQVALRAVIDDDALGADNGRLALLESREHIRVVLVDRRSFGMAGTLEELSAGQWIRRALEPSKDSPMQVIEVEPAALDPTDLRRCDVVILPRPDLVADGAWEDLRRFVDRGGMLFVTPPGGVRVHQWPERLVQAMVLPWRLAPEVSEPREPLGIDDQETPGELLRLISAEIGELLRPVVVHRTLPVAEHSHARVVLRLSDGAPLLLAATPGEGAGPEPGAAPSSGLLLYLSVAPELGWTNLPSRPLMVPLLHESIRQGLSQIRAGRQSTVGVMRTDALPPAAAALLDPDGRRVAIEGARSVELPRSGLWTIADSAGQPLALHAVNLDPRGGATDLQPQSAVGSWLNGCGTWEFVDPSGVGAALARVESGAPVSRSLLLLLLVLVVAETTLARWFSHAIERGAPAAARPLGGAA